MITITRLLARQLRHNFRRALLLSSRFNHWPVTFDSGPYGLRVWTHDQDGFVVYHEPTPLPVCRVDVPYELLQAVDGTMPEPVTVVAAADGDVVANWHDKSVPRSQSFAAPSVDRQAELPALPDAWSDNPPEMVPALAHAFETTDQSPARYALNCVRLRGKNGSLAATEGHQIYLHRGFNLGFNDEVLIRRTEFFAGKHLPGATPVQVGRTDNHLAFRIGPWTLLLPIEKDKRFPRLEDVVPSLKMGHTNLTLSDYDAQFLAENLPQLPDGDEIHHQVTVELKEDGVAIRAQGGEKKKPVELVLTNSQIQGEPIVFNSNRQYVLRAISLGFRQLCIHGPDNPVQCHDGKKTYVWALLGKDGTIATDSDMMRVVSPPSEPGRKSRRTSTPSTTMPKNRINQVPTTTSASTSTSMPVQESDNNATQPIRRRRRRESTTAGSALEQTIVLRDQLREVLASTKELVRTLKTERRNQKSLKLALDSLKQLQPAA